MDGRTAKCYNSDLSSFRSGVYVSSIQSAFVANIFNKEVERRRSHNAKYRNSCAFGLEFWYHLWKKDQVAQDYARSISLFSFQHLLIPYQRSVPRKDNGPIYNHTSLFHIDLTKKEKQVVILDSLGLLKKEDDTVVMLKDFLETEYFSQFKSRITFRVLVRECSKETKYLYPGVFAMANMAEIMFPSTKTFLEKDMESVHRQFIEMINAKRYLDLFK